MPSFIERSAWMLDDLTHRVGGLFKQSIDSYCDLETAEVTSSHALVDYRGALVTLVSLHGVNGLSGKDETEDVVRRLTSTLGAMLSHAAYSMQFVFEYDPNPETGAALIKEHTYRLRRGAQRNGLVRVDDVIDDMEQALVRSCAFERCTLVLRTSPQLLRGKEIKTERKRSAVDKSENLPAGGGTQNTRLSIDSIVDAHGAFVDQVCTQLRNQGIINTTLSAPDACRLIRTQLDPDVTAPDWTPLLPGDPITLTDAGRPAPTATDYIWPRLGPQLMPRDPEILNLRTVAIGDRAYMPLQIERAPKEPKPFARLFSNLRKSRTPYRISFRIQGDGLGRMSARRQTAAIMSFSSSQNKRISTAFKKLESFVKDDNGVAVCLSIDAVTWAPRADLEGVRRNVNKLTSSLQAWGGAEVAEIVGSPLDSVTASCAGLRIGSPSNAACVPLSVAFLMQPIVRPCSPWATGSLLLRSGDGKLFPYRAYSKAQDAWISLIFAPMGRGKSVLLNSLNFGLCLDETNTQLPFIRQLDIGFSSSGMISLLQQSLPQDRQHEALYKKLRMTPDCAINPMDTPLGCRRPLPGHGAFLVDLISYLATPLDSEAAPDGVPGIAKMVIDMAYKQYSDYESPKPYNSGVNKVVDNALDKHAIATDDNTTWWEVTDALTAVGDTVHAYVAQSYAMPLLSDCAALAKTSAVTSVYQEQSQSQVSLGHHFWRLMTEAVSDFPILNAPTKLNFGAARIISLDLQDVAPKGNSGKAVRQTGVMYSVAMWVMSSDFFVGEEILVDVPSAEFFANKEMLTNRAPDYRAFHERRISDLREAKKRVAADEFHRTEGQPQVRAMFNTIIREGRKWTVEVVLASQRHEDFDDTMIGLSTARFILGTEVGHAKATAERLGMGESAAYLMANSLTGPSKEGAPVLASFNVKGQPGTYTQFLTNMQGARSLWAFSSSGDDVRLRSRLYKKLGPASAREVLALAYPGGSVDKEVERRGAALSRGEDYGSAYAADHDPILEIEQELLDDAKRLRNARLEAIVDAETIDAATV